MDPLADRIRQFIATELNWGGSASELTDDLPLLEASVLDSLGVYELVKFLEEEVGVDIDDEDLVPENFASVADLVRLARHKEAGAGGGAPG